MTDREHSVLRGLAAGLRYGAIAASLRLSVETVRIYAKRVRRKLQVETNAAAVFAACRLQLLRPQEPLEVP